MSDFAGKVQAAYSSRTVREVVVPEWGATFHVGPITILQLQKIMAESDGFRRAARIIQVRAKKADGLPVYDEQDFDALCAYGIGDYGPAVVARVAAEIMADVPTAEDVAKN